MKTEIRYKNPPVKIAATLGLFAFALLVVSMIRFPGPWAVVIYAGGAAVSLAIVGRTAKTLATIRRENELHRLQMAQARFMAVPKSQFLFDPMTGQIVTAPDARRLPEGDVIDGQVIENAPPLLGEIGKVQRCLIVGPASDSGKTTLLQWIIATYFTKNTVVFDPHAYPGKWHNATVIGGGRDYEQVEIKLKSLLVVMSRRYDEIARGLVEEEGHERINVVIDEWRAIVKNTQDAAAAISALLTEGRKASINVFIATHSERAKPLGLEGEYDLKDGYAIIRLTLVNGRRSATLDFGNGEYPVALPGPFVASRKFYKSPLALSLPEPEPEQMTEEERAIVEMNREGENRKAICEAMGWTPGGKQYKRIDDILARWG